MNKTGWIVQFINIQTDPPRILYIAATKYLNDLTTVDCQTQDRDKAERFSQKRYAISAALNDFIEDDANYITSLINLRTRECQTAVDIKGGQAYVVNY